MNLAVTNIVEFRGSGRGVVVGWADNTPTYVVGARFTNPLKKWDENGNYGSSKDTPSNFDIVAVYDGSSIASPTDAFKASLKLESLPKIWEYGK